MFLEATHGQWLYCSIQIHDRCKDTQATLGKEELQKEIEAQQEMDTMVCSTKTYI